MSVNRNETNAEVHDQRIQTFLAHLATDRGASAYTQRKQAPLWEKLERDDFRSYLRFLGRHELGRAAIQLRFCTLRTFYKFLIRHGVVPASPIKNLALPKLAKRLPKFLTAKQMEDLLAAPLKLLAPPDQKDSARAATALACRRDVAILE